MDDIKLIVKYIEDQLVLPINHNETFSQNLPDFFTMVPSMNHSIEPFVTAVYELYIASMKNISSNPASESLELLYVSMIYLSRLLQKGYKINIMNIKRLFIGLLLLTIKYCDDVPLFLSSYSQYTKLPVNDLALLERTCFILLQGDLYVTEEHIKKIMSDIKHSNNNEQTPQIPPHNTQEEKES